MTVTLSDEVKQQVIIAAATVAGPEATNDEVGKHVSRIAGLLDPSSSVQYAFTQLEKQAEKTADNKVLIGTLLGLGKETIPAVGKENPSNRGIIILRTKFHEEYAIEAKELLRTEIANGAESIGSQHLNGLKSLVGHKLRLSFALEVMGTNGRKVRVLRDWADLGPDAEYDKDKPEFQPAFYEDAVKAKQVSRVAQFYPKSAVPVPA